MRLDTMGSEVYIGFRGESPGPAWAASQRIVYNLYEGGIVRHFIKGMLDNARRDARTALFRRWAGADSRMGGQE